MMCLGEAAHDTAMPRKPAEISARTLSPAPSPSDSLKPICSKDREVMSPKPATRFKKVPSAEEVLATRGHCHSFQVETCLALSEKEK